MCYDLSAIGIVGQYFWTSQLDFMGFLCIFFLDSHVVTATITWVILAVNSIGLVLWKTPFVSEMGEDGGCWLELLDASLDVLYE